MSLKIFFENTNLDLAKQNQIVLGNMENYEGVKKLCKALRIYIKCLRLRRDFFPIYVGGKLISEYIKA